MHHEMSTYQRWLQEENTIQSIFDINNADSIEETESRLENITNFERIVNINNKSEDLHFENYYSEQLNSNTLLFLIVLYGITIVGGFIGNASLIISLCSSASVRLRNPLLLALCFADISVAIFSAPSTISTAIIYKTQLQLSTSICKILHFLQVSFYSIYARYIRMVHNNLLPHTKSSLL